MKRSVLHLSPLFTLATCFLALLCLPSVSSASSPPADIVHFCVPFDYEQWRRDHPRPAAKPLADLNVGEPRTVRLIYFLPSDRSPQQDIDAKMDSLIKDVQQSYAEVMEYHGFGRKTFRFETDGDGKAVVHHVKGKFNDEYYHTETSSKVVWQETAEQFDLSRNVYLIVLDVGNAVIDGYCGQGTSHGPEGGVALLPAPTVPANANAAGVVSMLPLLPMNSDTPLDWRTITSEMPRAVRLHITPTGWLRHCVPPNGWMPIATSTLAKAIPKKTNQPQFRCFHRSQFHRTLSASALR